jgi:site-specific DNA-methyltransferase (adenine-specific)
MNNYYIKQMDCIEFMKTLPDNSVDMCLTDPPYGTTRCKWDSVINQSEMWEQLRRICKKEAAIVLFGTNPFASTLIGSAIDLYKYDWVWCKSNKTDFVRAKLKPMNNHEMIMIFSKSSVANGAKQNMKYYPQGLVKVDKIARNSQSIGGEGFLGRGKSNMGANNKLHQPSYIQEFEGYPATRLYYDSEKKTVHPTQKPVALLEYLIKTYTLEGEVVLDFTFGSGSTGLACLNTGRKFIGCELDEKYFEIAKNRLENHN